MIYHLGMICATFSFDSVATLTQVPTVTNLHANHYPDVVVVSMQVCHARDLGSSPVGSNLKVAQIIPK